MRIRPTSFLLFASVAAFSGRCVAQEMRIYTRVYDAGAAAKRADGKDRLAATTLTLFHAGRVYDYIPSLGEVIIYEPTHKEFTILKPSRNMATVVHVDQIKRLVKQARDFTEKRIADLRTKGTATANAAADRLEFQLAPQFRTAFNRKRKTLSLSSGFLQYDAKLEFVKTPEFATAYRRYADWIHRLNYVLHPRVLMPGSRLKLNAQLSARQALPVEVVLRVNAGPRIHLRAEHQIRRSLNQSDRDLIREWNGKLRARSTRNVTLRDGR
ncbi:MAG: hypothetical protein ACE5KM_14890 [Planctomycetaceae bacterium]